MTQERTDLRVEVIHQTAPHECYRWEIYRSHEFLLRSVGKFATEWEAKEDCHKTIERLTDRDVLIKSQWTRI
jgi:hypothetical protein